MKLSHLSAMLLVSTIAVQAQERHATSKGSALVGGSASLSRTTREGTEATTNIQVSPNVLFLVADRVAIGGIVAFARGSGGGYSTTSIGIGPAARIFFAEPGVKTQPFIEGRVSLARLSVDGTGGSDSRNGTTVGASAGLLQMVTRQVGISSELFWDRTSGESVGNQALNSYGLRFGFTAFLIKK